MVAFLGYGGAVPTFEHGDIWSILDRADLDLIRLATGKLYDLLAQTPALKRVDLNFPGIGNGRLNREDVLPIISVLPDKVYIWERSKSNGKSYGLCPNHSSSQCFSRRYRY